MSQRPKHETEAILRLNQRQAALLLGVSARSLRDWSAAPRNSDNSYNGPALVAWRVGSLIAAERERFALDGEEPGMIGPTSPALERWRLAKAAHEELDLAARRGELVPRDTADGILSIAASKLRRFGEWLQRRDAEAGQHLDQTLAELESDLSPAGVAQDGGPV